MHRVSRRKRTTHCWFRLSPGDGSVINKLKSACNTASATRALSTFRCANCRQEWRLISLATPAHFGRRSSSIADRLDVQAASASIQHMRVDHRFVTSLWPKSSGRFGYRSHLEQMRGKRMARQVRLPAWVSGCACFHHRLLKTDSCMGCMRVGGHGRARLGPLSGRRRTRWFHLESAL